MVWDEEQISFLGRLFDLNSMPSKDYRYRTAYEDIRQHTYNNYDWEDDWIAIDDRFKLLSGPEDIFLKFLALTLHPRIRIDPAEHDILYQDLSATLAQSGWRFHEIRRIGGRCVYEVIKVTTGSQMIVNANGVAKKLDAPIFTKRLHELIVQLKLTSDKPLGHQKTFWKRPA